jgi:hypothetical protein
VDANCGKEPEIIVASFQIQVIVRKDTSLEMSIFRTVIHG